METTIKNDRQQEYQNKLDMETQAIADVAKRWGWMAYVRGGLFLASVAMIFPGLQELWGYRTGWFVLSGLLFVLFLVIAFFHEGMQANYRRGKLLCRMYRESLARLNRDWENIKVPNVEIPKHQTALAKDLDLLGPSSLFKLLGIVRTPLGINSLADWILNPSLPSEVVSRQAAVAELANESDWRERFQLKCESLASSQSGPSQFVEWCERDNFFDKYSWLLQLSRVLLVVSLLAIFATVFGWVTLTYTGPVLIATLGLNFFLTVFYAGAVHEEFNMISTRHHEITYYHDLLDMMARFDSKSGKLKEIQTQLFDGSDDVRKQISSLGTLVWLANWRRGVMFLVYLVVQFLGFWDIHILRLLENWKAKHGSKARAWFDNLGQWESLCAMAKLSYDQPDWVFPKMTTDGSMKVTCQTLGHPLLSDSERVNNDCKVGPEGTVLLVTGSNMSGKSTLLRSVGLNVMMAQMGSVVCAEEMSLPPLKVATSMRVSDSLAEGVSFFMAELKRLKEIVDQAEQVRDESQWSLMFLLDEILQGTNSRERQVAVSRVVRRLIDDKAIGCISTHDLDLAKTDDLQDCCNTVHFAEKFEMIDGQEKMVFDYQMHQGISPTTNALKLLEIVGLGERKKPKSKSKSTSKPKSKQ